MASFPANVLIIRNVRNSTPRQLFNDRSAGDGWHSDVSYELQPPGVTFLKIDLLPPVGGDTLWASGYAAYNRLSPQYQKFVETLFAVHSGEQQVEEAQEAGHTVRRKKYVHVHPVVRTHPVTGWKALYVQPGFTRRIVGVPQRESDSILKYLFNVIEQGVDFQVRFKWTEDTVAVWGRFHINMHSYVLFAYDMLVKITELPPTTLSLIIWIKLLDMAGVSLLKLRSLTSILTARTSLSLVCC